MPETTDENPVAATVPSRGPNDVGKRGRWSTWRRIKWAVRLGVLFFVVGIFIVGLDRLFYYPSDRVWATPAELRLAYEDVTFPTSDGLRLSAWFLPATGPAKGTVIHFHGNAANITNHFLTSHWLVWEGYNVLVFDYRGYGKSEGSVDRAGTIRDGHAALDYVLSRADVDPQRVFAFGQSLGGAVATVVAAERPEIRAVVLDSTFSSYRRIGSRHLQKMLLLKWPCDLIARLALSGDYEPIDYVNRIAPRPLLVIASSEDDVCFAELGRELFDRAAEPKEWLLLKQGEHLETVAENIDGVQRKIVELFERAGAGTP